jgi:hypothetical protein
MASETTRREAVSVDTAAIAIGLQAGLSGVTANDQAIVSVGLSGAWHRDDNLDTDDPFSCPFAAIKKTQS